MHANSRKKRNVPLVFDREKYRYTVFIFTLTIYDHGWPCTSSGFMSLILGFINFHVLREVYAIFFFSITSFMNFQLRRAGNSTDEIPICLFRWSKKKNLLRRSLDSWELFGGKIGGGRVPPSDSRTLAVLGWWSLTFQWSTHRPWAGDWYKALRGITWGSRTSSLS